MGLTVSDAVRMMLARVARDGEMPFEIKKPNATTMRALRESVKMRAGKGKKFKTAEELFKSLDKKSKK